MNHRPKCKMQNKKLLEDTGENPDDLEYGDHFFLKKFLNIYSFLRDRV